MEEEKEEKSLYILGTVDEGEYASGYGNIKAGDKWKRVKFLNHRDCSIMFCTLEVAQKQCELSSKRTKKKYKVIELNPIEDEGTV